MLQDVKEMLSRHWREFLNADLNDKGMILIGSAAVSMIGMCLLMLLGVLVSTMLSIFGEPKDTQTSQQPQIEMRIQVLKDGEWKTVQ